MQEKKPWVRAKYKDIIHKTAKATLFLFSETEIWLPNSRFRFSKNNYINLPQDLAVEKRIDWSDIYHQPNKIEPIYNQQAIDDLKYE